MRGRTRKKPAKSLLAKGIAVKCLHCGTGDQCAVNRYHQGRARCPACGGPVERVHQPGKWRDAK